MEGLCQYSSLAASRAPGTARADTETSVLLAGPGAPSSTPAMLAETYCRGPSVIRCWLVCRLPVVCSGMASADALPPRSDCQFGATPPQSPLQQAPGAHLGGRGRRWSSMLVPQSLTPSGPPRSSSSPDAARATS
jgi:hypothetical protein